MEEKPKLEKTAESLKKLGEGAPHKGQRKPTIYEALHTKLGREPRNEEVKADVHRILTESMQERAAKGKLSHQR